MKATLSRRQANAQVSHDPRAVRGHRAERTIRSGRTTTARRAAHPAAQRAARVLERDTRAVVPPHDEPGAVPAQLGGAGPEDVVQPAAPSVDEHLGLGHERAGQPPPGAPPPLDQRTARAAAASRLSVASRATAGIRRDDGQHPPADDVADAARRRSSAGPSSSATRMSARACGSRSAW